MAGAGLSRRVGRGGGRLSPLEDSIRNLLPYSFVETDYYSIDGVSGKVSAFLDKVKPGTGIKAITAAHAMAQATSAQQVSIPATYAGLNGRLVATFGGSQYYQSNSPASSWTFMHDGSGAEAFIVFEKTGGATYYLLATNNALAGFNWQTSTSLPGTVLDAAGGFVIFANSGAATWANEKYASMSYSTASTPDYSQFLRTAAAGTDNNRLTPAATAPQGSLMLGASTAASAPFVGVIASVMIWNRVLTATERAIVRSYISKKYGVT